MRLLRSTIGVSAAMASEPSGAPDPSAAVTGPGTPIAADAAFTKFAACMKDHGIDIGTPVVVRSDAAVGGVPPVAGAISISGSASAVAMGDGAPAPFDAAAFKAANDACASILEDAGIQTGTGTIVSGSATLDAGAIENGIAGGSGVIGVATAGGDVTKMADDLKAFAACMRSKGVDLPDPVVDTKAGSVQLQLAGDPGSAAFQEANKACGAQLPFAPLAAPAQP